MPRPRGVLSLFRYRPLRPGQSPSCRYSSSSNSKPPKDNQNPEKSYSGTMRLPKTSFALQTEPVQREAPFRERSTSELYKWQWENAKGPLFVLHDGPPYANGNLHMGHALNKVLKDIINRFQVLQGRRVSYIPGWDCHGLPIECKALEELKVGHEQVPPAKIRETARGVASRAIDIQREEFKQFGVMADWSEQGTYRTFDHDYEIRQLRVFQELVRKGLIYRHYRPVYWSPSSKSALAEAELSYEDNHRSFTVYVKFPAVKSGLSNALQAAFHAVKSSNDEPIYFAIWTTTPWTLPANMALAVNPELEYVLVRRQEHPEEGVLVVGKERVEALTKFMGPVDILKTLQGQDLLDTEYTHMFNPSTSSRTPHVVPWNMVKEDSGTGIVHMAPAHGAEDYTALKSLGYLNGVPIVCPVDADGKYTSEVIGLSSGSATAVGELLVGKEVMGEGSKSMVKILEMAHLLLGQQAIKHRYPYDWKTKKPVITRATSQWFASVDDIKEGALKSLDNVVFHPEISRSRLTSFVRERSEWCISRQRTWGIPIPALYDVATDEAILTPESLDHIISVLDKNGVQHWFEGPVADFIPPSLIDSGKTFTKGEDTVDVWFDSGTSWSLLRDSLPKEEGVAEREYLADVCLEGSDQHRGWFQSLLLTAVGTADAGKAKSPYKHLITHGFTLDDKGKKMSKSIGNVISPLTIINGGKDKKKEPAYGADALRLWAASVEYGRDVSFGPRIIAQSSDALKKIRNTVRFMLSNIRDGASIDGSFSGAMDKEAMSLADRYVMDQLLQVETTCKEAYTSYKFAKVVSTLNGFVANTLSSLYFDITKDCLYADAADSQRRRVVLQVMNETLRTIVPIVAPILPHLAEEVHQTLNGHDNAPVLSVFTLGWKSVDPNWRDEAIVERMQHLLQARSRVNELLEVARGQRQIGGSLEAGLQIVLSGRELASNEHPIAEALMAERDFLAILFIVSDVCVLKRDSTELDVSKPMSEGTLSAAGQPDIVIRVVPPAGAKCPRCWQRNRPEDEELCTRCATVIKS
ncbi:isoleucine-tRNA ligase [Tulasnella sp. JGI-2019a]|nr:isoleucine-tRNA ligase [Tulasnella sp. JGI-2019a]